jgi:hypothetical protein
MWIFRPIFFAVIMIVGCGGNEVAQQSSVQEAACRYPANADTDDGSMSGCHAGPPGQLCLVSNGATVNLDGGVSGGTESCKSLCGAAQYELSCTSTGISGPIPDPATSLGCVIIPGPTPSDALFYCCPCAH